MTSNKEFWLAQYKELNSNLYEKLSVLGLFTILFPVSKAYIDDQMNFAWGEMREYRMGIASTVIQLTLIRCLSHLGENETLYWHYINNEVETASPFTFKSYPAEDKESAEIYAIKFLEPSLTT